MLVLTRKQGETIQVGNGIEIKVIRTGKGTVKIGIEAPANVKVLRGELAAREAAASETTSSEEPVRFVAHGERSVAVDFAGYFPLPQTA